MQRCRERQAKGRKIYRVELNESELIDALHVTQFLGTDTSHAAVEQALQRVIETFMEE